MDEIINIQIIKGLPILELKRELTDFDLAPVTERENSIMFILDDDPWELTDEQSTMKLRFRHAGELDTELRKLHDEKKINLNGKHFMELSKICRVVKIQAKTEEEKERAKTFLYAQSLKQLQKFIDEFNMTTLMMGVTK